jgi:NAD(P)-dependent dehydrogenase (short-subunit alcohol dehydrogenase family)
MAALNTGAETASSGAMVADATACAVVFGAGGGIGAAFVRALAGGRWPGPVVALSRAGGAVEGAPRALAGRVDVTDEASVAAAVAALPAPPRLVIVTTGVLHGDGFAPERSLRQIDAGAMARVLAVNTIGPALVAKHVLPLMPRAGRGVFAALSARVGSIGDNRLGGWMSYRASKAALNQLVRCFAIEMGRTHSGAVIVGLHPGTVDTPLSRPFQANVPEGKLFGADFSAAALLDVLGRLTPAESGGCFDWAGARIPE